MKHLFSSLFFMTLITATLQAQTITEFLSQRKPIKLATFMDLLGLQDPGDRDAFHAFYYTIINDIKGARSQGRKNLQTQRLEQQGMNALEIKHPQWARELSDMLNKDHVLYSNAHTFVIRFAALELYHEQKARARNSTWAKVRNFFNQTKETVTGWVSSFRSKGTAV